jgi:hypothetical protein
MARWIVQLTVLVFVFKKIRPDGKGEGLKVKVGMPMSMPR